MYLKKKLDLKEKYNPLWLIKLTNKDIIKDLRDGLLNLDVWFVIEVDWVENEKIWDNIVVVSSIDESDLLWFDFIVCDNDMENIDVYIKSGVVPIINRDNHLSSIFKEFNPIKNEWNSFFYELSNKWLIFATIIKYTENYKFPFDNKNLVKNLVEV